METNTAVPKTNGHAYVQPVLMNPIRPVAHIMREQVRMKVKDIVYPMRGAGGRAGTQACEEAITALTELVLSGGVSTPSTSRLFGR